MSYLEHESIYRPLVSQFLQKTISVGDFIPQYFAQWKADRDAQWSRVKAGHSVTPEEFALSAILDPIFTSCDADSQQLEPAFAEADICGRLISLQPAHY